MQKKHGFCLYLINKHRTNKCIIINGNKTSDDKMVISDETNLLMLGEGCLLVEGIFMLRPAEK